MAQRVTVWHANNSVRTNSVLERHGDVIDDIFLVAYNLGTGGLTNMGIQNTVEPYRTKWPQIRWWLTIQSFSSAAWIAMGTPGHPLRDSVLAQMDVIYDAYPWLHGLDLDAEGFGSNITKAQALAGYKALGDHARARGLKVCAALPAATEGNYSVGGETWLDYAAFGEYFDHVAIMTYDFAWSGSAPGPISPYFWIKEVYDWAAKVIPRNKILRGVSAYGQNWLIHTPVEDLPDYDTWGYRGNAGAYYWFWFMTTGQWNVWGDETNAQGQKLASWLTYRDKATNSPFALIGCYWWSTARHVAGESGMTAAEYDGRAYLTRYGSSAANVVGQLADQTVSTQYVEHAVRPTQIIASDGKWHNQDVHNLTIEILKRVPQSATIMDDDCANTGSLDLYYTKTGDWHHWREGNVYIDPRTYGQFRVYGYGKLALTALNGGGEYHVQGRFQFARSSSRAGVYCGSFEATVDDSGSLALTRNGTVLATRDVSVPGTSGTPGNNQAVVGLRVRGNRARVYYNTNENSVPIYIDYTDSGYVAGPSGMINIAGEAWFDHVRWGDAWWYNPREAVDVQVGNRTWTNVGRLPRTDVTWDAYNRFRPNTDVEEPATRTKTISPDWDYIHVKGVGIPAGSTKPVRIIPRDTETWIGTTYLCDPKGTALVHYGDAEYMAHCMDEGERLWGLEGIAVWRLGQEDTRFWERLKGGRLDPANRIPILA